MCVFERLCERSGSGAGAENGAVRARKSDERERDLKNTVGRERKPRGAVSGLNWPFTIRSNLIPKNKILTDFVN